MADELTIQTIRMLFESEGVSQAFVSDGIQKIASGTAQAVGKPRNLIHRTVVKATATEAALGLGAITSPGWIGIKNLGARGSVFLRRATGEGNFLKVMPGETQVFRLAATAPYIIADEDDVRAEVFIVEN